jgi:hypothetical protein
VLLFAVYQAFPIEAKKRVIIMLLQLIVDHFRNEFKNQSRVKLSKALSLRMIEWHSVSHRKCVDTRAIVLKLNLSGFQLELVF